MLIGVELVQEFCETVITTGRLIDPHPPVSALLISHPEGGKTSIATAKNSKAVIVVTDVTGRGIVEICKLNPEISHIIINDMVAIMAHRQTVNRGTQAMLNALTEEGIQSLATPGGVEVISNGRRGIIACMTMDIAKDGRSWWNKIGFASRMIPFAYSHSAKLTLTIKQIIDAGNEKKKTKTTPKKEILVLPATCVRVEYDAKFSRQVREISDQKSKELKDPTGYRRLKQFHSLTCGHALRRSRKSPKVGKEDIEFLHRIFPYISYDNLTQI